jgi:DNA polymerase-3 subunit gamma/tau
VSLALARKYRPATFDDLIGQEPVSQTLSLALQKERLSHAYLFSGLRGSGKTSTARIFAKALLCENGPTAHPCRTCAHCTMAEENNHMDIIEMDAASNRGIEDIKELIEHTKYQPSSARYKIFIIDEVHMLTNQAFNALLKTLEEPPNFVKFILATTDPLKLPATILSRTQHFRFKKIPQPLIQAHLEHILNLEDVGFESDATEMLARTGAGSLRDSLTLLDQAIVYSKDYVDVATVTQMLGIIEPSLLEGLIQNIMHQKQDEILNFIKVASDYEAEMILDELTLYLKSLLLSKSTLVSPLIIERFFRVLAESKQLLSLGSDGEFVLTLALFKMMESLEIREIDSMIKQLEKNLSHLPQPTTETVHITMETPQAVEQPNTPVESPKQEVIKETPLEVSNKSVPAKDTQQESTTPERTPFDATPKPEKIDTTSTVAQEKEETTPTPPHVNETLPDPTTLQTFEQLKGKIYDRSFELGEIFEAHITFHSFQNGELSWESTAQGEARTKLGQHYAIIRMFVQELFGVNTKITNIPKKKAPSLAPEETSSETTEPPVKVNQPILHTPEEEPPPSQPLDESQMKSSCIAPEAGETEAAKEKDPSTLLQEPMIKEAIELFNPKRVRIKRNS